MKSPGIKNKCVLDWLPIGNGNKHPTHQTHWIIETAEILILGPLTFRGHLGFRFRLDWDMTVGLRPNG